MTIKVVIEPYKVENVREVGVGEIITATYKFLVTDELYARGFKIKDLNLSLEINPLTDYNPRFIRQIKDTEMDAMVSHEG